MKQISSHNLRVTGGVWSSSVCAPREECCTRSSARSAAGQQIKHMLEIYIHFNNLIKLHINSLHLMTSSSEEPLYNVLKPARNRRVYRPNSSCEKSKYYKLISNIIWVFNILPIIRVFLDVQKI